MFDDAVAVTAFGAVTALGAGVEALWQGLLEGRQPFSKVRAFGVNGCRAELAGEVTAHVPLVASDRSVGLAVMAANEALRAAPLQVASPRVGLIVGSAGAGTAVLEQHLLDEATAPAEFWRRYQKRWLADSIAQALFIGGPRTVVNTACSSSAVAIALGVEWLRAGDCDAVLALGTDELGRFTYTGFHALRAMDPVPCKPFDRNRAGLTMGEGAGCLVLQRARDAKRSGAHVRGWVCGVGLACDAHHLTAPDPEGRGAARALGLALAAAKLEPAQVGFVNAHGTGTQLNDAAEVASLERALGARVVDCPVHSIKATTGHCMGAAGAIEAIVTLRSLETGFVPPTAGLMDCEFDGRIHCVKDRPMSVTATHAVSTNFGFGGNDAALVFSHA